MFPRSWYVDSTPEDREKWSVPSCRRCNQGLGKLEEDLLTRMGLCLDSDEPDLRALVDRVMRSMDPTYGRNSADRKRRLRKRRKYQRELFEVGEEHRRSIYPGFEGVSPDNTTAIGIPKDGLDRLAEKFARGVAYRLHGVHLDDDWEITFYPADRESVFANLLEQQGARYGWGPALFIEHAVAEEDKRAFVLRVMFWRKFQQLIMVTPQRGQ